MTGVKGSPVKSGRPDWQSTFFEYNYALQEPTKEPSCCAKTLSETCLARSGATASLQGQVPPRQSRPRPTVNESKITEPPHICTATPTPGEPAGASPGRTGSPPAGHAPYCSNCTTPGQAWAPKPSLPTPPWPRRPPARENCIRTSRHDGRYLHGPPENKAPSSRWRKYHPGQQPPQCDVLTNESSTF